jgi:hypothetical protein
LIVTRIHSTRGGHVNREEGDKMVIALEGTYLIRKGTDSSETETQDKLISQIRRIDELSGYEFMHLIDNIDSNGATGIAMEILRFKGLV